MSDSFHAVKQAVSLPALLGAMGAGKQGSGHWNPAPCCGHKGSLNIVPNTDEKVFKCHSCEAAGSVIDLAMKVWNLDEAGALKRLAADFNVPIEEAKEKKQKPLSVSEKILCAAADFYHGLALNDPESPARGYFCKKRGHSEDTFRKMQVGFANGGLLSHLKGLDFTEEAVIEIGLAVTKRATRALTTPEDFYWRGLVLFPVIDHAGKIISFTSKDPSGKVKGLMLPGAKKNWFLNMAALGKSDELIVVEGQNDLASLFDVGCLNAIGTGGVPTGEQFRILKNYLKKGMTVFACFDSDPNHGPGGNSGGPGFTRLLCREVMKTEATVKVIALPTGFKDIDEYLQAAMRGKAKETAGAGAPSSAVNDVPFK